MTDRSSGPMRLRAGRVALIAAMLSAVGLVFSAPALSVLSWVWFLILMVCLGLCLFRLRRRGVLSREKESSLPSSATDASSAFLSTVGHDLRQPLQAISLYAATLATHPLPEASLQLIGGLEAAAETLSSQFEEVMAIAKIESERVVCDAKPVRLGGILSSTVAAHLDTAHDKALHLRYVDSSLYVHADEIQLACALDRLVAHAVKTTERGGVLVGCRRRGNEVLIEVRDTSAGVAPDLQAEVFQPFSRYGQRLVDRGLGLVFAQRVVQRLGGTLSLSVLAGRGNIFTIQLPRLRYAA